jgi:Tfp pilus assembly protein PilV
LLLLGCSPLHAQALQKQLATSVDKQVSDALDQKQKQLEAAAATAAAPAVEAATAAAGKAADSATAADGSAKAAKAEATGMKAEVTAALEKKMHAALDASLVTLRKEAGSQAVAPLRKEFDELRDAIKRNAQWMLQTA